jgi:transcriptional regulator with GAF, ATPase, and Fis domain
MHVDAMDFFRQVTIRICGSLDTESALFDTYRYIRRLMPLDEVSYTHFVPDMGAIQFVACATRDGGKDLGLAPMPLPPRLLQWLKQDIFQKEVYLINRPEDNPLSRVITEFRGMDADTSILVLRLILGNEFLGSFNLACAGRDRYTDAHAALLSTVKEPFAIALANCLQHRETLRLKALKEEDNRYLRSELKTRLEEAIVGMDFGLKGVMAQIRHVADSTSPVLLLGETGTGKEVIARAVHRLSPRSSGPFVTINCGAIPGGLIDSELFGHEKGAFTGALAVHRGRFERANGGTLFLDEIGELPLEAQVRLLRVLQEREIERVGAAETIPVDIRIIAATHRDLNTMAENGGFRMDLLFRLNVFPVTIPPLRERKTDIPALAQHFFQKKGRELGVRQTPKISQAFLDRLICYDWPGNVRELENFIERTLIMNRGGALVRVPPPERSPITEDSAAGDDAGPFLTLDEAMKRHIQMGMRRCGGQIEGDAGVARLLGIKPNTLRARMRKLGIAFGRRRGTNSGNNLP